jgi:hypothetical protein
MPLWSSTDNTSSSPIYTPAQVNLEPNATNRDALYHNTTPDAFVVGETIGVQGVNAASIPAGYSSVATISINAIGSGYANGDTVTANTGTAVTAAVFTVTTAPANTSIATLTITNPGNYSVAPTNPVALKNVTVANSSANGATATATFNETNGQGITHTGWHKKTVGSGGRAGRVHYECLVAGEIK